MNGTAIKLKINPSVSNSPSPSKTNDNSITPNTVTLKITPTSATASKTNISTPPNNTTLKITPSPISTVGKTVKLNVTTPKPLALKVQQEYRTSADNYMRYADQRDHVYNISDTYLGSDEKLAREERIFDLETMLFKNTKITVPQAVERLFVEITSNAGDNAARSLRKNIDPGEIRITMDRKTIKVRNGGIPIPIEIHPVEKIWVPEMILGILMSSSNYDKEKVRTECGRNGFGAKLTNIFSKKFTVTIGDPHNQKHYFQCWTDNMKNRNEPVITSFPKTGKSFVEIEYTLDFERFKYSEYPDEAFGLFSRHAADMAFSLKIPIFFNENKFDIGTAKEYAKLYLGKEAVKHSVLYLSWPEGTETVTKKNVEYSKKKGILPVIEICAVDTPDEAIRVAFANGMCNRNGGVHYEAAFKAVTAAVLEAVNGTNSSNSKKKGKTTDKKEKKAPKLTVAEVKRHVSLFVSCWVPDPKFDSQSKNELMSPTPKIVIDEKILKPIMNWELVARLYAELDAKLFRTASKTDGKKKRHLSGMEKLQDANKAGSSESSNCTLYITEGDSALTFALRMCSAIPNGKGRDYIGGYPIKGKMLNVMNAPRMQTMENKEINDLKKILGLREGVNYMLEENYQTLRYGHLMILSDSDKDGLHIKGLVLNFFHCKFPSLLLRGYVKYLRTKIVEVKKGKNKIKFYTEHEYDEWIKRTPDHETWKPFYYKGLGTSEVHDVEEEAKNPNIVMTLYDEIAPMAFRLAFDKNLSDNRKQWIMQWVPDYTVSTMKEQPISKFINHEFIQFSIADIERTIPRFTDGLKISQRKIMWTALLKWGDKSGNAVDKMKVAQFAAHVSDVMNYHYGEKSLEGAIVNLAQNYVSTNNLEPLEPCGDFGARLNNIPASSRYVFTRPQWSVPLIYKKEDFPILNIQREDNFNIEPVTLLPILPMHLINSVLGIGTGFSTFIPAHNPLDIVYWLESKIKGLPLPTLIPWYRGFKGEIKLKNRKPRKKDTNESSETDNEDLESGENNENNVLEKEKVLIDKNTKITMVSSGVFVEEGRKITVTEIPIGRTILAYKNILDKMRDDKIISKYDDYSTTDVPHFEIYGMKNPTLKDLKLTKSFGMSNMVLLDDNNKPVKYESINAILETFYSIRLGYYVKRKINILREIDDKIVELKVKINFISAILKGYDLIKANSKITDDEANNMGGILVLGRNKKDIAFQMTKFGFNIEMLKTSFMKATEEEIQSSLNKVAKLEEDKKIKEETSPEQFWLQDLSEFVAAYCRHYKLKYESPKKMILNEKLEL